MVSGACARFATKAASNVKSVSHAAALDVALCFEQFVGMLERHEVIHS
jgi:hypothetical protein